MSIELRNAQRALVGLPPLQAAGDSVERLPCGCAMDDSRLECLRMHAKPGQMISVALAVEIADEAIEVQSAAPVAEGKTMRDGDVSRERPKKRKRPRDATNELIVLKAMEDDLDDEWSQATLFDICVDDIVAPAPKYRRQYMVQSISRLIKGGWVSENEQGMYSLIEAT